MVIRRPLAVDPVTGVLREIKDGEELPPGIIGVGGTGSTTNVIFGSGPPTSPLPDTLYVDPDCKELFFLDTSSNLCTSFIGEGCLLLSEDISCVLLAEDGVTQLRF